VSSAVEGLWGARRERRAEVGLALAGFVGSAATIQKYGGTGSVFAYLVVLLAAVLLLLHGATSYVPSLLGPPPSCLGLAQLTPGYGLPVVLLALGGLSRVEGALGVVDGNVAGRRSLTSDASMRV
jgi:hypothetical protein